MGSGWREVELKQSCWRRFSSDAVMNVDISQGYLWIRRVKDVAVDFRLLVNVYWDRRTRSRALRGEGSVRDVRMMALPAHLYSELSNVVNGCVVMYSRRIHRFGARIKAERGDKSVVKVNE